MHLLDALPGLRGVAFDLDGTLYQDREVLPGAVEAVDTLRRADLQVRFLTNTTSRSAAAVAAKMRQLGFAVEDRAVFSPPRAAGEFLRRTGASAHLVVREEAMIDFAGVQIDDERPDYVVLGDLEHDWTFPRYNRAFQLLQEQGARLIALGRTRYWQTADGLQLDAGAFVAGLEYATGREAIVLGKPAPEFFAAIAADMATTAERVAVVGDDVLTDVGGAQDAGLRGVLVCTGKFRPGDLDKGVTPDLVVDGVAELAG